MKNPGLKLGFSLILLLMASAISNAEDIRASLSMFAINLGEEGAFSIASGKDSSSCSGSLKKNFMGVVSVSTSSCSASGFYSDVSNQSRVGIEVGNFYWLRGLKNSKQILVSNTSPLCPSIQTQYNYLVIRGRNFDDFKSATDYSTSSAYVGGVITYAPSTYSFTGNKRFSFANLTADTTTAWGFSGFKSDTCPAPYTKGQLKVVSTGAQTLDKYATWSFDDSNKLATFQTYTGNPLAGLAVPVVSLSSTDFSSRNALAYTGIYTHFSGAGAQSQEVIYVSANTAGTTFTLRKANTCNPQTNSSCPSAGVYLNDASQSTSFGTLTCGTTASDLNAPSTGFCKGTLTLSGVTGTGIAVCMPAFNVGGKEYLICNAQKPNNTKTLVSLVVSANPLGKLAVEVTNGSELVNGQTVSGSEFHIGSSGSTSVTVKVTNPTGYTVSGISPSGISSPFGINNLSVTSLTSFSTGSACSTSIPPFTSCNLSLSYGSAGNGLESNYLYLNYNNGSSTTTASALIKGTRGLNSIAPDFAVSGDYFSSAKKTSLNAVASLGGPATTSSVNNSNITWSSNNSNVATVDASGNVAFVAREGKATISSKLWSGIKSGTVDAIPYNPGEVLTYSSHSVTTGTQLLNSAFNCMNSDYNCVNSSAGYTTFGSWPLSPALTVLAP